MFQSQMQRAQRAIKRALSLDHVDFDGYRLPPEHMRYCGAEFKDDAVFLASGRSESQRLKKDFGLSEDTAILEIGCGPGRLPIGILAEGTRIGRYDGVDIDRRSVEWGQRYITTKHPNFNFHRVSARHERYNPNGEEMSDNFRLDFENDTFDIIYLHSVFANMNPDDVYIYCTEFERLLKPSGSVFLTAFIEEDVPDVTFNPDDYIVESHGPLNVARYEKGYFFDIVARAGLEVALFGHRDDLGGQSVVHLRRASKTT